MADILKIEDRNRGSVLKQGDLTVLKYHLYDIDNEDISQILGQQAKVAILNREGVVYRTTGQIDQFYVCEFTIDEVLPVGKYHIEFIVLGKIFPSNADLYFTITRSSLGESDVPLLRYQVVTKQEYDMLPVKKLDTMYMISG